MIRAHRPAEPLTVPLLVGAAAVSVLAGLAVQRGHGPELVGAAIGAGAVAFAGRWRRGLIIGLLVLTAANGIPYIDMSAHTIGPVPGATDILVPVLLAVLLAWNLEPGAAERSPRLRRLAWAWSIAFLAWWTLIWLWSISQGVPAKIAGLYGRDFLEFALLIPLTIGALRGRDDLLALSATLGVATLVYSLAQLAAQFSGFSPSNFVHASFVGGAEGPYQRYFAQMGSVATAIMALGVGLVLLGRDRAARLIGSLVVAVVGTAVVLQFTRAFYAGFVVAFVLLTAVWASRSGQVGQRLRRAAALGVAVILMAGGTFVLTGASFDRESAPSLVVKRTSEGVTDVKQASGTYGERVGIYEGMFDALGRKWPVGLGFLDPSVYYEARVPRGDIRNSDVGLMNAVMTMGVVGLLFVFAPVLAIMLLALRSTDRPLRDHWLLYGTSLFLLTAVLSSPTITTLFSVPGLVPTAVLCAAACHVLEPPKTEADGEAAVG